MSRSLPTLYLNENIDVRLVPLLSSRGISAIHTEQVGNKGVHDRAQLEYAAKHNYVVLTHNRWDFRKLHEDWISEGAHHAGIIVIGNGEPEYLAERIMRFFRDIYPDLEAPFCKSPPPLV